MEYRIVKREYKGNEYYIPQVKTYTLPISYERIDPYETWEYIAGNSSLTYMDYYLESCPKTCDEAERVIREHHEKIIKETRISEVVIKEFTF